MNGKYAQYLLERTQQDYNRIAEHFAKTRSYVWSDLEYLKKFVKANDKILDLGCGNGRLLGLFKNKDIEYIGIDNSERLIEIAQESSKFKVQSSKFIVANALDLSFENNYFDKVFSIAVFHHIPSKKFRLQFLKEAKRVLKPGGFLILTVWNLYQRRYFKYLLKYLFLKLAGRSRLDFKDIFYPWKNPKGEILAQRYIHCFTKRELKGLLKSSGFIVRETEFLDQKKRNVYIMVQKPL